MTEKKKIIVIGGGTVYHVRSHLALSAIAYGNTAKEISRLLAQEFVSEEYEIQTMLTRMGDPTSTLETHQDIDRLVNEIVEDKTLYTNRGDVVFTPFMGIGSEVYQALKMKRKAIGIELKKSYYDVAARNCENAEKENSQLEMFCEAV